MSITDKLIAMNAAMETAADSINAAALKKRATAAMSDVTKHLSGRDRDGLLVDMSVPITSHIENKAAHGLTPAKVGTYSKTEVDGFLKDSPTLKTIPVSQYGQPGYLPTGATAFFEGATSNVDGNAQYSCGALEDDGTMVWIRNGTNGSTLGAFYMYMSNAFDFELTAPNRTNRRYQPPFVPVNKTVRWVGRGSDQVVPGALQDSSGALTDYFVAFTGGTLDSTNHQGCFISKAVGDPIFSIIPEFFLGNEDVFIIGMVPRNGQNTPLEYKAWRITKAQLISGTTIVPEALTGWTTSSFYGIRTGNTIQLTDCERSISAASNPIVAGPRAMDTGELLFLSIFHEVNPNMKSAQRSDGTIRTRHTPLFWIADQVNGKQDIVSSSFSFTWNPSTKWAAVDSGVTLPFQLVTKPDGLVTIEGNGVVDDVIEYVPGAISSFSTSMHYHPKGYWFTFSTNYTVADDNNHVAKGRALIGPAIMYDALHYSRRTSQTSYLGTNPLFGSAIGGSLVGVAVLSADSVIMFSEGRDATGKTRKGLVYSQQGAPGYRYLSQYNGSYMGYAPHQNRYFISDTGRDENLYHALLTEIYANGTVAVTGAHFLETGPLSVARVVEPSLNLVGQVTIPANAMGSVRTQTYSMAGITSNPTEQFMSIIVPQNPALKAYGVLTYLTPTMAQVVIMAELNIQGDRSGVITGFSVARVSPTIEVINYCNGFRNSLPGNNFIQLTGGVVIYEGTDAYFLGGAGKNACSYIGTDGTYDFRVAIPKATNTADWSTYVPRRITVSYNTNYVSAMPGLGFGYCPQFNSESDSYSKLVFRTVGNTMAQYKAWNFTATTVIVSQDVAQGWLVYFTQEVPALLNGVYKRMAPTTIDLSAVQIFPANTTFYAYLKGEADPAYVISVTKLPETASCMLIGEIITGDTSITSINVDRVTRLNNYRISTRPTGSATPGSVGDPSVPAAHLSWK